MATMSMNTVIHAAVRRDLQRFLGALDAISPGDTARAARLGVAWDNFDHQLTFHHEGEHEIAWPALEQVGVTRETIAEMDAEHEVMAAALAAARAAMSAFRTRPDAERTTAAREAVAELQRVTVDHLDHEEQVIEPVYLANEGSAPLQEMGRRFAREQKPPQAGRFFAWVLDGATPEQRAAAGHGIPKPVLLVLSGLFGRGYRRDVASTWRA